MNQTGCKTCSKIKKVLSETNLPVVAGGVERLGLHPLGGLLYEAAQVVDEPPGADGVTLRVLGDGLRHLDTNI
jgi:hypothetical protein